MNPLPPEISINDTELTEGDNVAFNCSSTEGNPVPEVRWYRNNEQVTSGAELHPPSEKYGTTSSLLVWTLSPDDHRAEFRCEVENKANIGDPETTSTILDVRCEYIICEVIRRLDTLKYNKYSDWSLHNVTKYRD